MEPSSWTLEMLAQQFMNHVESCDARAISLDQKVDGLYDLLGGVKSTAESTKSTVDGYQKFISGSWTAGWGFVGRILGGVILAVASAVAVLSIQNHAYHTETASKVSTAAAVVATTTTERDQNLLSAIDKRNADLLAALKKK